MHCGVDRAEHAGLSTLPGRVSGLRRFANGSGGAGGRCGSGIVLGRPLRVLDFVVVVAFFAVVAIRRVASARRPVIISMSAPLNVRQVAFPSTTAGAALTPLSGEDESGSTCGALSPQLGGIDSDPRGPALPGSADGTSTPDTAGNDPNALRAQNSRTQRAGLAQPRAHHGCGGGRQHRPRAGTGMHAPGIGRRGQQPTIHAFPMIEQEYGGGIVTRRS